MLSKIETLVDGEIVFSEKLELPADGYARKATIAALQVTLYSFLEFHEEEIAKEEES